MNPCTIDYGTKEYKNLVAVASLLNAISDNGYYVGETYFDYGQDWVWTTIMYHSKWGDVQALYPRQWEEILLAGSIEELAKIAKELSK